MQPWTCLWADCRLCNWIGLFSKLFKTSHLLKPNCFQTGVINGVLCLLFNFAVNRTASVFIQGPALLCTGWFTIQCVNVVAVWNKGEPVYPNKFEGEGEEVNCSLFTELQLESRTKRPQGKRDREMIGGAGLAQRPCNFRVVLTQGAQASCRGAQVPPGPLEELRWQLKTFCKWFLCFAQSSSSVVSCIESNVTSWQVLLWFPSPQCLCWLLLLVLNWSQRTHFLDLSILSILALLLSLSISAITAKSISKEIKLWRSYIALSRHEK